MKLVDIKDLDSFCPFPLRLLSNILGGHFHLLRSFLSK